MAPEVNDHVPADGDRNHEDGDAWPAERVPGPKGDRDEAQDEVNDEIEAERELRGGPQTLRDRVTRPWLLSSLPWLGGFVSHGSP